jgi:hypothetical protein
MAGQGREGQSRAGKRSSDLSCMNPPTGTRAGPAAGDSSPCGRISHERVAEWYRLQLKEHIWKGLAEHSLDRCNIGFPHQIRLIGDPDRVTD